MSGLFSWLRDDRGAAAAEMALVTPLLLALMMGSVELGNFFYNEHKLVKSVRDGARYAARQRFSNYSACPGDVPSEGTLDSVFENTKLMVRKGTLDNAASDLLPNWTDADATFDVTVSCKTTLSDGAGTYNTMGIYANNTSGAPTVLVEASLPYRPIVGTPFGFSGIGLSLNASQSAAVAGL